MATLDNPKFFSIITDYIMSRSLESNDVLIPMLMNLRCNKVMKRKIETLLSIRAMMTSIDIVSLTKKHRRLYRSNHNVISSSNIITKIDPFNDINPLIIETRRNLFRIDRTLDATVNVSEQDNTRVITISICDQDYKRRDREYDLTLTKITEDMYYQEKYRHIVYGRERITNSYIYNINRAIITVVHHGSPIVTVYYSYDSDHYEATYYMEDGIVINEHDSDDEEQEPMISMNEAAKRTFNYIESLSQEIN